MSNYAVTATLTAIDNFSSVFQRAGQAVQSFGKSATSHLKGIGKATMAAGAATTAMGIAGIKSFGDFQQSLNTAAVIAGGTSKDINGLADVANRMGAVLPLNANQCAEAMVNMARNGASISDIKKEFPAIAEASTAAGEDIDVTAGVVQEAMNIWKSSLKSPQQAAAILVQTANASNASIGDMQQAMATMGPVANMTGMDMQTTATAIGLLTNHGFSAAQASLDLSHAITMMVAPSRGAKKTMKELGLSFTDAKGNMKPFPEILQEIADKTDTMGKSQKTAALKTMFGAAGMKAIEPLLEAVKDKTGGVTTSWDAFAKSIDKASGSTKKATETLNHQASEMQKNIGAKIEQVGGNWDDLKNKALSAKGGVNGAVLDMINHTLNWATTSHSKTAEIARDFIGLSPVIGTAITAVGGFITNFGKIANAIGIGITAIGNFGKTTTAVIRVMVGMKDGVKILKDLAKSSTIAKIALAGYNVVAKTGKAIWIAFKAVLSLNPFVLVIASIAAVVVALTVFFTTTSRGRKLWKQFCTNLGHLWHSLSLSAKKIFSEIGKNISQTWKDIKTDTKAAWNNIKSAAIATWNQIGNQLKQIWHGIINVGKTIWNSLKSFFVTIWNNIKTTTMTVWNSIKTVVMTIWQGIKNTAITVFNTLKLFFMTVWNGVKNTAVTVWNSIKTALVTIWNGLKTVATIAFNAVKTVVTLAWNNIKTVTSGVWNVIKGSLSAIWNGIKSAATGSFNAIKETICNVWSGIKSITSGIWNAIKSLLTGNWSGLKSSSSSIFHGIHQIISSVWSGIRGVTSSIWGGIQSALSGIWNSISSTASSIFHSMGSNISSTMHNLASNVSEAAHSMMSRFVNAVRNGGERAISRARSIAHNIVSGIQSGLSNLYDVASNAMQGFVNGVIQVGQHAIDAAKNIAHNIVSTIQSALDIHSPSKVMRDQVGIWIPAGVAVGMQKNMSTVTNAANDVANAATVTIPAVKTNKFTDSLHAIKKASRDVLGTNLNGQYSLNVNKQPAHINLSLGGHEFETFVSDISKQQGTNARLQTNYRF